MSDVSLHVVTCVCCAVSRTRVGWLVHVSIPAPLQHVFASFQTTLTSCLLQAKAVGSAAHLVALRREAIGKYNVKDAWTVDQLQAAANKRKQSKGAQS